MFGSGQNEQQIAKTTLWEIAQERAARSPDEIFIVDELGRAVTFLQLWDQAVNLAGWLEVKGVTPGQCAMWQFPTSVEAMVLGIALSLLCVVQVPILPIYGRREIGFVIEQTGADYYVIPHDWEISHGPDVDFVRQASPKLRVIEIPGDLTAKGAREAIPTHRVNPQAWVFYTSGTTSDPKGVRHSEATLLACAYGLIERYEIVPSDRVAIVFAVTHIGGAIWFYLGLLAACRLIFVERFGREAVWTLRREGVTVAGAGLPFFNEYIEAQRTLPEGVSLFPSVRAFTSGGMRKPPSIHYTMKDRFGGSGVLGSYGMTEAPILTAAGPKMSDEEMATTEGPPMRGVEFRVVRDDGALADEGETGELRVRAPQVMLGYLDALLDRDAFDELGYLRTGDLGHFDPMGNIVIVGRLKDVIIRKGENVSAKEIEDALMTHPSILEVAVIGLPDPASGERVCAVIVSTDPTIDVGAVAEFLDERGLMRRKFPEQVEFIDSLPRSPTDKVDKNALRCRFWKEATDGDDQQL
jgi:acyl-CoA synthetase (AMP-forming)/AMP-acid ligase II